MWGFNFKNTTQAELDAELVESRQFLLNKNTNINLLKVQAEATKRVQKIFKLPPDGKFAKLRKHLLQNVYEGLDCAAPNLTSEVGVRSGADSVLGPKGNKILESHLRKPTPSLEELYWQKENRARGPSCVSNYHLHKIEACLKAKFALSKLSAARG